jgi:ABC-type oligopeptide transport system ATPase subunit
MALLEVRAQQALRPHAGALRPQIGREGGGRRDVLDRRGEMFGLVGESGSGKSTTGRCILRLMEPTAGDVRFKGENVLAFSRAHAAGAPRHADRLQDPYSSLNPRMRVRDIVEEPLVIHQLGSRDERRARVRQLFELVGLEPAHLERYPHEFSGGQRQRIGIARALALNPAFVIADEAVSALDVSIQAQVVKLLLDLQAKLKLTFLFIAHDLRLVEHICGRVAVMYRGRIVEMGETKAIFANPTHPYTRRCSARFRCSIPTLRERGSNSILLRSIRPASLKEVGRGTPGRGLAPLVDERLQALERQRPDLLGGRLRLERHLFLGEGVDAHTRLSWPASSRPSSSASQAA